LPWQAQQPAKVPRIGYLLGGSVSPDPASRGAFLEGLQELGYIDGQNIILERRYADGQLGRLRDLAAELVALPVDIIVTLGTFTAEAARDATSVIPIVMVYTSDPVASGLVGSLARPGGNITGVTEFQGQLAGKRLELLK
jgi:putative ABC transport system substrate-binding protein